MVPFGISMCFSGDQATMKRIIGLLANNKILFVFVLVFSAACIVMVSYTSGDTFSKLVSIGAIIGLDWFIVELIKSL